MGKKAQRSEATRVALVRAARELFAERGFADTPTGTIVERAGVTRGALYHQFADKEDLFRAVYEDVERDISKRITEALANATDPLDALRRGAAAWLDACMDPAVRRITLQEAASVLSWEHKREIDQAYGLGLVRMGLEGLIDAGYITPQPVEPMARLLLGALNEAGVMMGESEDPERAREEAGRAVGWFLDALATGRSG